MNVFRDADEDDEDWRRGGRDPEDLDDDSGDDDSGDDDSWDDDDSDEEPTVPCPSCRRMILEDSPRCPYCERYISEEDHPGQSRPAWVIVTAVICLAIAVWWAMSALSFRQ
jgi:hypothetical protein